MTDAYFASLLTVGGVCVGFMFHAASLAAQTRARRYVLLALLSLLEAAYCVVAARYLSLVDGEKARVWGQAICAFTPYITYVFGALTIDLAEQQRPRWLLRLQRVNLFLTTLFAGGVVVDLAFGTSIMLAHDIVTDLASTHRHRVVFTVLGQLYLGWVSIAFTCFALTLFSAYRARRDLFPIVVGCVLYFCATILDFGILVGWRDGMFIQHFGFFAIVAGCWRVLSNRFEDALGELQRAVKRLEEQRNRLLLAAPTLHRQKLDSLGTLAAGVAHEINNPIQGIMNYALLLKRSLKDHPVPCGFADEIAAESKHVAEIVRSLLRFGRADTAAAVATDIEEIVDGTLALIKSGLVGEGIKLRVNVDPNLPEITCRAAQLQQVLMNLVTNARDALVVRESTRTDEKVISIDVTQRPRDGEPWLFLEVKDTGDGFDPALTERIFDPFFTTKGKGGTGLGLSVSHGIIQAHAGRIAVENEPGRGARFRVEIPCRHS